MDDCEEQMNEKSKLSQIIDWRSMPSAYHDYFGHLSADLYRPHQYHEDIISRHRQILVKSLMGHQPVEMKQGEVQAFPSNYSLPSTSLSPATIETASTSFGRVEGPEPASDIHAQLCPHHTVHFEEYDDAVNYQYKPLPKPSSPRLFNKMICTVAKHFLSEERDRKYYVDMYSCMPPPIFILTITLIELIFFSYYALTNQAGVATNGPIPVDSLFIYRPDKKSEVWRFFLYMVLHAGWLHLSFNLLVQLVVGLPLEMVHGSTRIGVVYMSGVLAGSLATSVFDSDVYLVGASGGVYALLAAHLANVLLNYNQIELGFVQLIGAFVVVSVDVGIAIYNRYVTDLHQGSVSYVAHLAGALGGLTIGLLVLRNYNQNLCSQIVWHVSLGIYTACILFALVYNIFF